VKEQNGMSFLQFKYRPSALPGFLCVAALVLNRQFLPTRCGQVPGLH
jgi:hypothetical protein